MPEFDFCCVQHIRLGYLGRRERLSQPTSLYIVYNIQQTKPQTVLFKTNLKIHQCSLSDDIHASQASEI